jgi:primosomal protein N' (replication factor Y)
MFYKIISDSLPIPLIYSYHEPLTPGDVIIVTIRDREILGLIIEETLPSEDFKIKPLTKITGINIGPNLVKFVMKLSEYTLYPFHVFIKSIIPKFYGRNKLIKKNKDQWKPYSLKKSLIFNEEQQIAVDKINSYNNYQTLLLYGSTGSGKTEVSIGAIINTIQQGKQVLILLPEISLINQWVERIKKYVDCPVIVYHSLVGKNKGNWESILYEKGLIILGARSAIFLPFQDLGLIIVDEEHDTSYKQDVQPIYNGRDAAVMRGFYENCPVLLASATPSLESLVNVDNGKYQLITMKNKFHGSGQVSIDFLPMESEILSEKLLRELKNTYLLKKKSIIFLNRRGYGNKVKCTHCHSVLSCKFCDYCLVYHKTSNKYVCHLCNYQKTDQECPHCKESGYFQSYGIGVEKVEEFLHEKLPDKKTMIFSSDTTSTKKDLEDKILDINNDEPSIIIGTQMLSKGHDLSNLHLIIVLDLNISNTDFRGRERSLQLLTQILGRIGRKEGQYKAFIQLDFNNTFSQFIMESFHTSIAINYKKLLFQEMEDRRHWHLPPFTQMINVYIQHGKQDVAAFDANQLWIQLHSYSNDKFKVSRPVPMAIPRKKSLWRYIITVMMEKRVKNIFDYKGKSQIILDVNPNFVM